MNDRERSTATRLRNARATDALALAAIALASTVLLAKLFRGEAVGSIDSLVGLYPSWALLGDRIREGDLPIWNPWLASGAPLAADLQSGWFYVPVMASFALLPIGAAALLFSAIHLLLAGWGMYALARLLGISTTGALIASISYMLSGWFIYRTSCCPADVTAAAWLPVVLASTEGSLQVRSAKARMWLRILTAFALAQLVSGWMGQGSYYAALAVGGYFLYRIVIAPIDEAPLFARCRALAEHLVIVVAATLALAIGGLLPRLEYRGLTSLAAGYPDGTPGGWSLFRTAERLSGLTAWYAGGVTLTLALAAIVVLRRKHLAPFWMALVLIPFAFATDRVGIAREIVGTVVPGWETAQENLPVRILSIAYLGFAMLAGGVVSELPRWRPSWAALGLLAALLGGFIGWMAWAEDIAGTIAPRSVVLVAGVSITIAGAWALPSRIRAQALRIVPIALLVVLAWDLGSAGNRQIDDGIEDGVFSRVDLDTYYEPSPAAEWLVGREGEPFRFAGIDPSLVSHTAVGPLLYGRFHADPETAALVVNHRAAFLGLEDAQSSNFPPMRLALYDDVLAALNGAPMDYHGAAILSWEALRSPYVDLLGIRYIVVPIVDATGQPPPASAFEGFVEVWTDGAVRILENLEAFPRAWLVHEVVHIADEGGLAAIADGTVDPATTAIVSTPLTADFSGGARSPNDRVHIERTGDEMIRVNVSSESGGLLVFSEQRHPGLRIEIDGETAEIIPVNHAFIGVMLEPGDHVITVRHAGRTEQLALGISAGSIATGIVIVGWRLTRDWRRRRSLQPA